MTHAAPARPVVTVSVDVDPVDLHLLGYGHRGLAPDHVVYQKAIPRLLGIFERAGVRATFFFVGRDVNDNAGIIESAAAAGHEIASHSHTHPMAFGKLTYEHMVAELADSRKALEDAGAERVIGFRAPNFDVDTRVVRALSETGYAYDASAYPTPLLLPVRMLLAIKSRDPRTVFTLRSWPFTFSREPFRWEAGEHSVYEFPTSVTPGLRVPFYHTMRYYMGEQQFLGRLDGFAKRGESLSYPLHAVDALGFGDDAVNPLLRPHPGMNWGLGRKLDVLEASLEAITERFESVTFRDRLERAGERAVA